LETSARALQHQVDAGQRKYSTAETILRQITQERDSAVSQLGVAFVTIEQLKVENESLKDENHVLRERIDHLDGRHKSEAQKYTTKEPSMSKNPDQRREVAKQRSDLPRPEFQKASSSRAHGRKENVRPQPEDSTHKDAETMFDLSSRYDGKKSEGKDRTENGAFEESEDSAYEPPREKKQGKSAVQPSRAVENAHNDDAAQDLTYLSFLDVGFPVHYMF